MEVPAHEVRGSSPNSKALLDPRHRHKEGNPSSGISPQEMGAPALGFRKPTRRVKEEGKWEDRNPGRRKVGRWGAGRRACQRKRDPRKR